jgi:hypothetical protein
MPLILPNIGLAQLLDNMIRATISGVPDLVLTLWVNDYTPEQDSVLADLTRATFGGFQEQVLTRGEWTAPAIIADIAVSTWGVTPFLWTVSSNPQTVYGWAAYDPNTLALRIVERFDVPRTPALFGKIGVLPRFTLTTFVPCP